LVTVQFLLSLSLTNVLPSAPSFPVTLVAFVEGAGALGKGALSLANTGVLAGPAGALVATVVVVVVATAAGGTLSAGAGVDATAGVVTVAVVTVAAAGSVAAGAVAVVVGVGVGVGVAAGGVAAIAGSAAAGVPALPLGVVAAEVMVAVAGSVAVEALEAAAAQWSAIIFTAVTARVLSVTPKPGALTLFPVSSTSWPRWGFRFTVLVVILKVWGVPSCVTV
jgi:hypothetical protein